MKSVPGKVIFLH